MSKEIIKSIIETRVPKDGMIETGIKGVQLFRVSAPIRCAPAVYEPSIVAIVSGVKEAVLDGESHSYDSSQYMCCSMTLPVEAGTSAASPEAPLLGVYISLETRVMTELTIQLETSLGASRHAQAAGAAQGVSLARWDADFTEALVRLLQLGDDPVRTAVLGEARLRELYFAVLNGEAGHAARRAYGAGNEIARTIDYVSARLKDAVTIDELASQVGMSRAVFHRKFKQATTMSPIQFVKSMRLNTAAMQIAKGVNVSEAAMDVGYVSASQFSREFKRMYGSSPRQWGHMAQVPPAVA